MSNMEDDFKRIVKNTVIAYQEEMDNFIQSRPSGSLTDTDVILMTMNVVIAVSTNMYYSLKEMLPTTQIDFDYVKATMINNLKDNFENIKTHQPTQRYLPLTVEQIKEIQANGFTFVQMSDGTEKKVTEQDIYVSGQAADEVLNAAKNEVKSKIARPH